MQSLIRRGQRAGTFRADLPEHWLTTTAFSLMQAAAQDAVAGRIEPAAAALITATLQAGAFDRVPPGASPVSGGAL